VPPDRIQIRQRLFKAGISPFGATFHSTIHFRSDLRRRRAKGARRRRKRKEARSGD